MKTAVKIICIVAVVALSVMPQMAVAMRSSPDAEFGYSEGATQLLEKWNPDVDFKKLKIGKAVMLMQ